jgi:hypothetical protein
MARCRPKLKTSPGVDLFLSRFAESEWRGVVRPWLEASRGSLGRSILVAPTRGQTQALKQRCLEENVPVLGVEFLTPGLARRKRGAPEELAKGLQLLVLRSKIEARLEALAEDDPSRGTWRSLASDLEVALQDFESLLRGGYRAGHFPRPELREVFGELSSWVESHGYVLGPLQDEKDALGPASAENARIADRVLVLAGGPEGWGEFFGLLAFVKRCPSVCVVLSEPEFSGSGLSGEAWVDAWEKALGTAPLPIDIEDPAGGCGGVADLWGRVSGSSERADLLVGMSRSDEMQMVAEHVERILAAGAQSIGVIFPKADAAHGLLARLLGARGIAFADLIGCVGTVPIETRILRALADLYERGCRLEELLALWPLLLTHGATTLSPGGARRACEELYEKVQAHAFVPHLSLLETLGEAGKEVARIGRLVGPSWPERLTPAEALGLFSDAMERLGIDPPTGWSTLQEFALRAKDPMPARALVEAIRSFIPEKGPPSSAPGKSTFARVTLTTVRRAAGVAWSHALFVEANEHCWPRRDESSCWLLDEDRSRLDRTEGRFSIGLPTAEERSATERRLYQAIARDTRCRVAFSAAHLDPEDPELKLDPNGWLERVLWDKGYLKGGRGQEGPLHRIALVRRVDSEAEVPPEWLAVWSRRRDPSAPFDAHFLGDPGGARPLRLSPSQIERGAIDPATLWFDAVIRVRRIDWRPFSRARGTTVGILGHGLLASALGSAPTGGDFFRMPHREVAEESLASEIARLRERWPRELYWDSFQLDVARAASQLLARVYDMGDLPYGAAEAPLPADASVPLDESTRIPVHGRMDLVLADRERWDGARVEILDFKTGSTKPISAKLMASGCTLLQLGVYLEAARSVGAQGRVWVLKPEKKPSSLAMEELPEALVKLRAVGRHLATGLYGALTVDRTEYSHGFEWPLACSPVPHTVLEAKFAATFGAGSGGEDTHA